MTDGVAHCLQMSNDEVYGSIERGSFTESDALRPSSPYSASKAGADLLVLAYHTTHGLPVIVTHGSNNYGPYQYPENLSPVHHQRTRRVAAAAVRRRTERARLDPRGSLALSLCYSPGAHPNFEQGV